MADLATEAPEGAKRVVDEGSRVNVVSERERPDDASAVGAVTEQLGDDLEDVAMVDDMEHREQRAVAKNMTC